LNIAQPKLTHYLRPQVSLIDVSYQRICRTASVHAQQLVYLGFEPIVIFLRGW
jgi:hypothetical protein